MTSAKLVALAALGTLGLSACNNDRGPGANSRICTPFTEPAGGNVSAAVQAPGVVAPTPAAVDPASALDDCLHRWGYTLAASSDRAQEVAMAVVAACTPALSRWNQQTLAGSPSQPEMAPSLLSGQPTTPIAEHYNYAQARALFYVVQGRAGKCAPPPQPKPAK